MRFSLPPKKGIKRTKQLALRDRSAKSHGIYIKTVEIGKDIESETALLSQRALIDNHVEDRVRTSA